VEPSRWGCESKVDVQTITWTFTRLEQHIVPLTCANIKIVGIHVWGIKLIWTFTHHVPAFQFAGLIFSYVSRSDEDLGVCALVGPCRKVVLWNPFALGPHR
jgi:hypothetical protein